MDAAPQPGFRIGPWWVDPHELTLRRGGRDARLQARTMALLQTLHAAAGRVVSKDELAQAVWGAEGATDDLIARHVSMIRQALGDDARAPKYLETVPRRGYRLNAAKQAPLRERFFAAAVLGIVLLAGLAWLWRSQPDAPPRQLASARPLLERGPPRGDLATSPNGTQLAYVAGQGVDLAGPLMLRSEADPPRQLVGGLNRFPAFHPDRPELAFFRHRGGCELHVIDFETSASLHKSRCGGPVSSPPLWVDQDRLWYTLDPSGGQPSRLLSIEVHAAEPEVLWEAPAGQQIQFPVVSGGQHFALRWQERQHALVRLSTSGQPGETLVHGQIRWLTGHSSENRLLLARYNDIDRFALYEIGLREKTLRLISNQHAVLSAAYLPSGVAYSSVDVRRQAVLFRQQRQGYSQSLLPDQDSIRSLALSPRSGTLVYVADTGRQQELRRRNAAGEITIFTAPSGTRLGRPAWSADELKIALPVAEPAEIRVFDAATDQMTHRIPLAQEASRIYLDEQRLWVLQRRPQGLTLSVLEGDGGDLEVVAQVAGIEAQLSDTRDQLYVADDQFRLLSYPLAAPAEAPQVLASVGSTGGWQVRDGLLYHACPAQPSQKATLCVLNLASGVRLAQPEITYYPSELSVTKGGGVLAAFNLEALRIDLLQAEWAQPESL